VQDDPITRRRLATGALAALATAAAAPPSDGMGSEAAGPQPRGAAAAGSGEAPFPIRPVRVLVAFVAGSATDTMTRLLEPRLARGLGQPVVVENRGGAGGVLGSEAVLRAQPDGHALLMAAVSSHRIAPSMMPNLSYDPVRDFTPIGRACTSTNFILVHPSVPASTLPELVEHSKRVPGGLSFAAGSRGSSNGLAGELLKLRTGANLTHIPYSNISQGVTDVIAGHIPVLIYTVAVLPHAKAGRLRALAVTSERRQPQAPEVPTAVEQGAADVVADSWFGLFGPAGLPDPIRDRLFATMRDALLDPEIHPRLVATGLEPAPLPPEEFRAFIGREIAKWAEVVRASGVTMHN
jgi:tripartite-type tricarboxylate transporter receptor subunit TctC